MTNRPPLKVFQNTKMVKSTRDAIVEKQTKSKIDKKNHVTGYTMDAMFWVYL